ncbi:hypothetical protein BGZ67_008082, partial [Mortierella alpina]
MIKESDQPADMDSSTTTNPSADVHAEVQAITSGFKFPKPLSLGPVSNFASPATTLQSPLTPSTPTHPRK